MSEKLSLEEKRNLLAEAHRKMVEKIEAARREYVETKLKLFPELKVAGIPASDLAKVLEEKDKRIVELEEKIRMLESKLKEAGKNE